ncbi:7-cyano-7-deazaguanine synthase QueC [Fictibacillus nanhaiensis]|uniref:7-cyano-7-deazaguanine synthase QueC n=1 Tax=Fictibacillus nanhaiensis TaxID=742169 RepID=UPI001C943DE2|nr:7-cyano-7-deazaguanine synthase QueC [Fictibacillus nanhaiensis]MBY6035144.1 7-cyano-7-deazaguanine synthase QueC [Fictibacillus nanhaiensis]
MNKKAVIVLSGGLDSTTCMGIAKAEGYELYPITFHYGQRHNREVEQAIEVGKYYDVPDHRIVDLTFLKDIGGSALTDEKVDVPIEADEGIPVTYVPARNMIFLALSSAYAEVIGATAVFTGVSAVDFSGYPDCRPEFIKSMEETINLATKAGVTGKNIYVKTPLINLSKKETIEKGLSLEVPYELTTSCYNGKEAACGHCDSCQLRLKGFKEAGSTDPIPYEVSENS